MNKLDKNRFFAYVIFILMIVITSFLLSNQGRIGFPADGSLYFWVSDAWSNQNSQHFSDPYSFSHILHGLLFFGILFPFASKVSLLWRLNIAVLLEAIWEVLENSATVIERYRDAGALGYTGDTIINSVGDLLFCAVGFITAHYLGLKKSIILFILIELVLIITIRDSFIINIIMLIHPVEAISEWQSVML